MIKSTITRKEDSIVYVTDSGCKVFDSRHPSWKDLNKKLDDFLWHFSFVHNEPPKPTPVANTYGNISFAKLTSLASNDSNSTTRKVWAPIKSKIDEQSVDKLYPEVYKSVVETIAEQLGVPHSKLKPETKVNFETLGIDSLDQVELCMAFEEEFGFEITDEEAEKHEDATIAQIVTSIAKHYNPKRVKGSADYERGRDAGISDASIDICEGCYGHPKYQLKDASGADSPEHGEFIRGYCDGYENFKSS